MIHNSLVVACSVGTIAAVAGFVAGRFSRERSVREAVTERDNLRAFVENAGVDFNGMRQVSQELTSSAAAISDAATRMAQIAASAEGSTVSSLGFGGCKSCDCSGYRRKSPDICHCGHHFSQHWMGNDVKASKGFLGTIFSFGLERICDICGKRRSVSNGMTCGKGHFICSEHDGRGAARGHGCPLCGSILR